MLFKRKYMMVNEVEIRLNKYENKSEYLYALQLLLSAYSKGLFFFNR